VAGRLLRGIVERRRSWAQVVGRSPRAHAWALGRRLQLLPIHTTRSWTRTVILTLAQRPRYSTMTPLHLWSSASSPLRTRRRLPATDGKHGRPSIIGRRRVVHLAANDTLIGAMAGSNPIARNQSVGMANVRFTAATEETPSHPMTLFDVVIHADHVVHGVGLNTSVV
jgi:hypothetical protein